MTLSEKMPGQVPDLSLLGVPKDGESRYFYIMHRMGDSPSKYAEGARQIVKSGGVRPGGPPPRSTISHEDWEAYFKYRREYLGKEDVSPKSEDGKKAIHPSIVSFLEGSSKPNRGADAPELKGLVAWYYLDGARGASILSYASKDELVFRVSEEWLRENALACLESPATMLDRPTDALPSFFLTALVVPLEFRITDPDPPPDDAKRRMTKAEVRDIIFGAHARVDARLRSMKHYRSLHAERAALAARGEPRGVNPF